jgi:hydroxyacylglutathione hydrolase
MSAGASRAMLSGMQIEVVPCLSDNYAYVLHDNAGHAIVVDPSETAPVQEVLTQRGLSLVGVWATHHHLDHVGGIVGLVSDKRDVEVVASAHDAERKRVPGQTRALHPGDTIWFGSRRVRLVFVPGHTLGAVAYLCEGALFSGDTLFSAGCGRVFEGSPSMMQNSLAALRALPAETQLYCGHEYTEKNLSFASFVEPQNAAVRARLEHVHALRAKGQPSVPSSLADELETNPFLRWDVPAVTDRARELGAQSSDPADVFAALRKAKDNF